MELIEKLPGKRKIVGESASSDSFCPHPRSMGAKTFLGRVFCVVPVGADGLSMNMGSSERKPNRNSASIKKNFWLFIFPKEVSCQA